MDLRQSLKEQLSHALVKLGLEGEVVVQDAPSGLGDFATPLAFTLAKKYRRNPAELARELVGALKLPEGFQKVVVAGPYVNFQVEPAALVRWALEAQPWPATGHLVTVEHTAVNPNKEWHVGHLRNAVLGDTMSRILRARGHTVEVQNYIDDTGRQAAEALFALEYFQPQHDGSPKYDHWVGQFYVRIQEKLAASDPQVQRGVEEMLHRVESGVMRPQVERLVQSHLHTAWRLGIFYDLLVWESDIVASGLFQEAMERLRRSPYVEQPAGGKFQNCLILHMGQFVPNLEEPDKVLIKSNGVATYTAKDIAMHLWKYRLAGNMHYALFAVQPNGCPVYTTHIRGDLQYERRKPDALVNVIDVRQSFPQEIVKVALAVLGYEAESQGFHHLAYEVVDLPEGSMSGRKGRTVAADELLDQAVALSQRIIGEKNPALVGADQVAEWVGVGAVRFAMVKPKTTSKITFRWEDVLNFDGDAAPYVQYAHARACAILRKAGGIASADLKYAGPGEVELAKVLLKLRDIIDAAASSYAPNRVAEYALELATAFNTYYHQYRVLDAEPGVRELRLGLVNRARQVLAEALDLLGIVAPAQM
ncbi:MAG: arginine--tRNA ligase [Deinococcus sp.]|nr:arginine--tRNA ligase [Deinococcus sp.]